MERLIELFDTLVDVRDSKGKRHCLSHIMIMSVCAILCGYYDFEDIADFCSAKKEWFGQYKIVGWCPLCKNISKCISSFKSR